MAISDEKLKIVINNYFKSECDVNTSIREAFEKGFRIGVKKGLMQIEADRKTENSSEKPNNCETCKYKDLESYEGACDDCTDMDGRPTNYEPKTEPQSGYCNECKWYGDKQVCGRCRHYNLYSHTKIEPQTERSK